MTSENINTLIKTYLEISSISSSRIDENSQIPATSGIPTALGAIKNFGDLATKNTDINDLIELSQNVRKIEGFLEKNPTPSSVESTAQASHTQATKLLFSIEQSILDKFENLDIGEQEAIMKNPDKFKALQQAVYNQCEFEVKKIDNDSNRSGTIPILYRLCVSESPFTRQLALECLKVPGIDINKKVAGATVLHVIARNGDKILIEALLKNGADSNITTDWDDNPLELAYRQSHNYCALLIAINNPKLKIHNRPPILCLLETLGLNDSYPYLYIQLLDVYIKTNTNAKDEQAIWKACVRPKNEISKLNSPHFEKILVYMLENLKDSSTDSKEKLECLEWLTNQICDRDLSGHEDIYILKKLLPESFLQRFTSESGTSILRTLSNSSNVPEEMRKNFTFQVKEEGFETFEKLMHQAHHSRLIGYIPKKESLEVFKDGIKVLEEKNFSKLTIVKDLFDKITIAYDKQLSEYDEATRKLEAGTFASIHDIPEGLYDYYIVTGQWKLLVELYALSQGFKVNATIHINKNLYHLMMDKLLFSEFKTYESFNPMITANALIYAFKRMKLQENEGTFIEENILINQTFQKLKDFDNSFRNALKSFILNTSQLIYDGLKSNHPRFAENIVKQLKMLEIGNSVLIPSGNRGHATCVYVTKTGENRFQIIHYNTGGGSTKWHARWENSNRYQTYDIVDQVPSESVLSIESWVKFVDLISKESTMDPLYVFIRDILGKGGRLLSPSPNSEDYEAKQVTGTCAMQSLMAFMRHQIMQIYQDSPAESEALYKLIKSKMFIQYHQDNLPNVDEIIQKQLPTVVGKLEAETTMVKIAAEPDRFNEAMTEIANLISQLGKEEIAKQLLARNSTSTLGRYATLRAASTALCGIWIENPDIKVTLNNSQHEYLKLAFAKLEHHVAIIKNIQTNLKEASDKGNQNMVIFEIFRVFVATPYEDFAIIETVNRLGNELDGTLGGPPEGMQSLLKLLQSMRNIVDKSVIKLADKLEQSGKIELAEWVRSYWIELGDPGSSGGNKANFD